MKSGIYFIKNKVNEKCYVGQAKDVEHRLFSEHLRCLQLGVHRNKHLQKAFNKYGEKSFLFKVLEYCPLDKETLRIREQYWIDKLDSIKNGYNHAPSAGSLLGFKWSDEQRKRLSIAMTGKKATEKTKAILRKAMKGKNNWLGRHHSEETKIKISNTKKSKKV